MLKAIFFTFEAGRFAQTGACHSPPQRIIRLTARRSVTTLGVWAAEGVAAKWTKTEDRWVAPTSPGWAPGRGRRCSARQVSRPLQPALFLPPRLLSRRRRDRGRPGTSHASVLVVEPRACIAEGALKNTVFLIPSVVRPRRVLRQSRSDQWPQPCCRRDGGHAANVPCNDSQQIGSHHDGWGVRTLPASLVWRSRR